MVEPSRVDSHSNLDQELASEIPEHEHPLNAATPDHNVEPSSPFISNPPSAVRRATPVEISEPSSPFISNPPSAVGHASPHQDVDLISGPDDDNEDAPTPQNAIEESPKSGSVSANGFHRRMVTKLGSVNTALKNVADGNLATHAMLARVNERLSDLRLDNARMKKRISLLEKQVIRQNSQTIRSEKAIMKDIAEIKKIVLDGKTELAISAVQLEATTKSSLGSLDASLMVWKSNILREVKDGRTDGNVRGQLLQHIGSEVERLRTVLEMISLDRESSTSFLSQQTVECLDKGALEASRSVEEETDDEVSISSYDRTSETTAQGAGFGQEQQSDDDATIAFLLEKVEADQQAGNDSTGSKVRPSETGRRRVKRSANHDMLDLDSYSSERRSGKRPTVRHQVDDPSRHRQTPDA